MADNTVYGNAAAAIPAAQRRTYLQELRDQLRQIDWRMPAAALGVTAAAGVGYKFFHNAPAHPDRPGEPGGNGSSGTSTSNGGSAVAVNHPGGGVVEAQNVTDDMSFDEAFAAARAEVGSGNFFEWRGQYYNTFTEAELDALGPDGRQEWGNQFVAALDEEIETIDQELEDSGYADEDDGNTDETYVQVNHEQGRQEDTPEQSNIGQEADLETHNLDPEAVTDAVEVDTNGDGTDDALLISTDDDAEAEFVIKPADDGNTYAFADTDNSGMIDTLYRLEGTELVDPVKLDEPFRAPTIQRVRHQEADLNQDGYAESVLTDVNNDGIADTMAADLNADGHFESAFADSDGDGILDVATTIGPDGSLGEWTAIPEPFRVDLTDPDAGSRPVPTDTEEPEEDDAYVHQPGTPQEEPEETEIEGLDNDADVGDFL